MEFGLIKLNKKCDTQYKKSVKTNQSVLIGCSIIDEDSTWKCTTGDDCGVYE